MEIAYRIGMVLEGYVTGIQPYGAFVALDEETQGLIHISECHHGFVDDIQNYLKVGQRVRVMIIDILKRSHFRSDVWRRPLILTNHGIHVTNIRSTGLIVMYMKVLAQ